MRFILAFIAFIYPNWNNLVGGCGRTSLNERIVGGYEPKRRAWPWIVSINRGSPVDGENGTGHMCAGTLIDSQWVITAAHCLDMPDKPNVFWKKIPSNWRVTAGMYNRTTKEQSEGHWQTSTVLRFLYHENFHDYITYSVHDIALLQLAQPFKRTDYVRPICIPVNRPALKPGLRSKCYIAGWGMTAENSTTYSLTLREVPMLIINQNYCEKAFTSSANYLRRQHICGGDWYKGNKDACKGDSGGPLACVSDNGYWFVEGIISWGVGCGRPKSPGVYTSIRTYKKWIIETARNFTLKKSNSTKSATTEGRRRRRSSGDAYIHDSVIDSARPLLAREREALWKKFELSRKRRAASSKTLLSSILTISQKVREN